MLRHKVRRVLGAEDLEDPKVPPANPFLDPELAHGQVPHLADAGALDDAEGSAGVRVHLEEPRYTQVEQKGPEAKSFGGPFDDSGKLGLSAR